MTQDTPRALDTRGNVRGRNTRARLLDAALTSFAARGFHGTSTRDLAEAMGMSPNAVYTHFRTKEELLFQLSLGGHTDIHRIVCDTTARFEAPMDQLREVVREFAIWHARYHVHARVLQYEIGALEPKHAEQIAGLRRDIERTINTIVTAGQLSGAFQVLDSAMTARAILSLGIDIARWYHEDGTWTPERVGDHYSRLCLRMVGHH
ncbi:TetR family transcriptional regulator [Nocardia sp. 852002-51101_SCH5132738]|nr:TetR family transcriptional regulator [Nocardia nova]OBA53390.1 TetR family transcriptional regulator [Nocardia sp. 852002-51101_SCH5132738]OBB50216.1 TetR family transcriptional regulator [Nocardia sp. 852002-51244_SCH5132740]OBF66693.1 TetR family transcriptional regulator [Mycobacterium sp. 852002-51759_SCH5129042]